MSGWCGGADGGQLGLRVRLRKECGHRRDAECAVAALRIRVSAPELHGAAGLLELHVSEPETLSWRAALPSPYKYWYKVP